MADDLIKEAREALSQSYDFDRDNRREAAEDLKFIAGFQWSDTAKAERAGRPMITINRSGQFLRQVSNPIRQNMPVIKVESDSDYNDDMAEIANGLMRRIQYNSSASHVYAQAVEHAVGCGIGWYRLQTDYLDENSFDQEVLIRRVFNPLSVYPDPSSLQPDRSDMNWCLVSELMPTEAFKLKWPKARVESMDAQINGNTGVAWGAGDYVRVAEYWRRKEKEITIAQLSTGQVVPLTAMGEQQIEQLKADGFIVAVRKSKTYTVEMTLLSGVEQLEDPYECPCKWIPIVPVIGAEIPLEKGVYRHGIIRFQREPQQLHNYFLSIAAESLGQQPKTPWLATPTMVGKFKNLWDNANKASTPYLLYEPDPSVPGGEPKKMEPPAFPASLVQMAQFFEDSMKGSTGIYDASLGARSNETSGVAIAAREEQGNQATLHYVDNLEHSLEHTGRIMLDMMPKVYDTERSLRIMGEDDSEKTVEINKPIMSFAGRDIVHNDMADMKFSSVRVVLGPSYASRRREAAQQILQLVQALPQIGMVAGDIIAKNLLDFDGAEQLAERLKATLPPNIMQMENPEAAQAMEPPPDPMMELQMQAQGATLQSQVAQEESKAAQEQAKAEQEAARVDGVRLDNALKIKKLKEPPPRPDLERPRTGSPAN